MSIALPVLFALAGLCSFAAIWHAIASNLEAVADLRSRVAMPEYGSEVLVTFREAAGEFDPVAAVRRPRQVRVPAPKPVTHRLHHFVKGRTAA
jgi:hypothetical protein